MDRLFEVPVWVDETQKWLSGLSKRTTCDDIVYAILYNDNRHETENTDSYAIFERWKGVEKALQGRTKILRVWRNWGPEQASVRFIMRRVDDIAPMGEYMSTKRRFKKWRHRRRYEHCHPHQSTRHGHCYECKAQNSSPLPGQCRSCRHGYPPEKGLGLTKEGDALDHDKLRRLQKMIRGVMLQEKRVKSMANRLEETELLIEKYEAKIHFHRTRKKGVNYVQRSLLHDSTSTSEDSLEDFISKANINLLEEYIEACDRLINVWESLITEESTIENLTLLIRQYGFEPCTALPDCDQHCNSERVDDRRVRMGSATSEDSWVAPWDMSASAFDDETDPEVEAVNTEFNRVMTVSVIQNITSEQLDREMQKYDKQMDEKARLLASLENELRLTEPDLSAAKPLLESDSADHFESRVTVPETSGVPVSGIESDFEVRVVASRARSSSVGACSPLEMSKTGLNVENMVLDIEKRKASDNRNSPLGSRINNSLFSVDQSLVKNASSTECSSGTIFPDKETESHPENTSNATVDNNCTINSNTSTTTNNINRNQLAAIRKGPRVGTVGGALRSDFCRTKTKRDWLMVLPSLEKQNGTQEKVTLNSDSSKMETPTPVSDSKSKTVKNAESETDTPARVVNQRQDSFAHQQQQQQQQQKQQQATQERELAANSQLTPSLLDDNSRLLLTPDNGSSVPSPIFKLDKSDDTDSTSDTGLGSMNSDEFNNSPMETLV